MLLNVPPECIQFTGLTIYRGYMSNLVTAVTNSHKIQWETRPKFKKEKRRSYFVLESSLYHFILQKNYFVCLDLHYF